MAQCSPGPDLRRGPPRCGSANPGAAPPPGPAALRTKQLWGSTARRAAAARIYSHGAPQPARGRCGILPLRRQARNLPVAPIVAASKPKIAGPCRAHAPWRWHCHVPCPRGGDRMPPIAPSPPSPAPFSGDPRASGAQPEQKNSDRHHVMNATGCIRTSCDLFYAL